MSEHKVRKVSLLLVVVLATAACRNAKTTEQAAIPDAVEVELASDSDLAQRVLATRA